MTAAIEPAGFFLLRTPLLPQEEPASRERLRAVLARPEIREAIYLATPSLDESIGKWERDPDSERGRRVELSLVRYLLRAGGRATPFGLFAGTSVGTIGSETELRLAPRASYHRHTRLDMDYVLRLVEALERDPEIRRALLYRPNPVLYRGAGRLRHVEARLEERRAHLLVALDPSRELEESLDRARNGATFAQLAAGLAVQGAEEAEAEAYLDELIDAQVLMSDLAPAVTGEEPLAALVARLRTIPAAAEAARTLADVGEQLAEMDAKGLGAATDRYEAIAAMLQTLPVAVDRSRLFQVDMGKPVERATLGPEPIEDIRRAIEVLRTTAPARGSDSIERFREAFEKRYEGREVPLLEALDEDLGVGFGNASPDSPPLLKGLPLPAGTEAGPGWATRETWLLRRMERAWSRGENEIDLEPPDLEALKSDEALPLPAAFAVVAMLAPSGVLVRSVHGPSGAVMLGRFCHADAALQHRVLAHLRAEEETRPDAVFAEIVHLGEGRIGNVLLRPVLRDYEIPYLARSGAPPDRQIQVADLRVSVREGRVVLRSERLDREVLPRLTSAHNFMRSNLPVYRFLCALQGQGVAAGLAWSWGPLESAAFLPRVRSGRAILSLARWTLDKSDVATLAAAHGPERLAALARIRMERHVPRHVVLSDHDNELPLDLGSDLCVDVLVHLAKSRESVRLTERFPTPEELVVIGPEGRFVHEILVPFQRTESVSGTTSLQPAPRLEAVRSFRPGSRWLYCKLYGPPSCQDRIVASVHREVALPLQSAGRIDRWFFLRYADPDAHLRVRFRSSSDLFPEAAWERVQHLLDALRREGQVHRFQLDTYEQEVERYGGSAGIELAERLFHADSEAVAEILSSSVEESGVERWLTALRGADALLDDLGFDLVEKRRLAESARDGSSRRADRAGAMTHGIAERFRAERANLEALFAASAAPDPLARRSERVLPIAAELREQESAVLLSRPIAILAHSFVHMHVNRVLSSAAPLQEMVLYHFLARLYASWSAKANRSSPVGSRV